MAERKPGSDRGRPLIDWEQAFLFYAALPPNQRCYRRVADEFGVSARTVERHGRSERWRERARELDRSAAAVAAEQLRDQRTEKLLDVEKLIDASFVTYATQLRDGTTRISPADLPRLHKLRTDLWIETGPPAAEAAEPKTVESIDPAEHRLQVLRALHAAGVLEHLLNRDRNDEQATNNKLDHPREVLDEDDRPEEKGVQD